MSAPRCFTVGRAHPLLSRQALLPTPQTTIVDSSEFPPALGSPVLVLLAEGQPVTVSEALDSASIPPQRRCPDPAAGSTLGDPPGACWMVRDELNVLEDVINRWLKCWHLYPCL